MQITAHSRRMALLEKIPAALRETRRQCALLRIRCACVYRAGQERTGGSPLKSKGGAPSRLRQESVHPAMPNTTAVRKSGQVPFKASNPTIPTNLPAERVVLGVLIEEDELLPEVLAPGLRADDLVL